MIDLPGQLSKFALRRNVANTLALLLRRFANKSDEKQNTSD